MTARAEGAAADLATDVAGWVGVPRYEEVGEVAVERGAIAAVLAACENGNPLYWDDAVAARLTGGPVAPPTALSAWFRPHAWAPGRPEPRLPLQVHFDLKAHLDLPEAVISDNTVVFHAPLRPGDVVTTRQVLRSVSDLKRTRLGTGRFWTIDVEVARTGGELAGVETYTGFGYRRHAAPGDVPPATPAGEGAPAPGRPAGAAAGATGAGTSAPRTDVAAPGTGGTRPTGAPGADPSTPRLLLGDVAAGQALPSVRHHVTATTVVLGALASRDWRPMHHDRDFAINRNGTRDIFLNTPSQAAWFERLVTDWTGPHGRLGRLSFQMRSSVFPGDDMVLSAVVDGTTVDDQGCGWAALTLALAVGERVCTTGRASVAVPVDPGDNPWARRGEDWAPSGAASGRRR